MIEVSHVILVCDGLLVIHAYEFLFYFLYAPTHIISCSCYFLQKDIFRSGKFIFS